MAAVDRPRPLLQLKGVWRSYPAGEEPIHALKAVNLSIEAGLASPERILQLVEGRLDDARAARPITLGLTMLRYPQDRFVTEAELAAVTGR